MKWSSILFSTGVAAIVTMGMSHAVSAADAATASGRISFTGAVVVPTCTANSANVDAIVAKAATHNVYVRGLQCGGASTAANLARSYALSVVDLDTATISDDRVLEYFAGYVKTEGGHPASAKLITQVYD